MPSLLGQCERALWSYSCVNFENGLDEHQVGESVKSIFKFSATSCLIFTLCRFYKAKKNHVVTTQTEHKCVLDSCRQLEAEGFEITYLPVQKDGLVDLEQLESAIRPTTTLVSVMTVRNF